jgi:hypothetical protein
MKRRTTAPKIIVIQSGQVIVNKREGMDQLDRNTRAKERVTHIRGGAVKGSCKDLERVKAEKRTEAFALAENGVTHGISKCGGCSGIPCAQALEGFLDPGCRFKDGLERVHQIMAWRQSPGPAI